MDLRIQRTKAAIKEAFLELREKKPIEKITVTELTKLANINKATFYLHYSDIYALSDEIEDSLIDEILTDIEVADKFFDDPQDYSIKIFGAFVAHREQLDCVFSSSRRALLADKIEKRVKGMIFGHYPQYETWKNDLVLSFIIQGLFHTVKSERSMEHAQGRYEELSAITAEIVARLSCDEENDS